MGFAMGWETVNTDAGGILQPSAAGKRKGKVKKPHHFMADKDIPWSLPASQRLIMGTAYRGEIFLHAVGAPAAAFLVTG